MHTGRKILNLRCDRKISQQDLARACNITPSALSKIEAGINSPRANIIWRIAQNLGVTVEYLLDECIPYPYEAYHYRQDLLDLEVDPSSKNMEEVTLEESAFLNALRKTHPVTREIAYTLPELPLETIRLIHFLAHHAKTVHHDPDFSKSFQSLVTGEGKEKKADKAPAPKKSRTSSTAKKPARKSAKAKVRRPPTKTSKGAKKPKATRKTKKARRRSTARS